MAKSPAHYNAAMETPRADSPAMRLGRLVHLLALEDPSGVSVWEGVRRGKQWDEFSAAHVGQEIVSGAEMETAEAMAEAILCDTEARDLLTGNREQSIAWQFGERRCAGRIDVWTPERVVELKTTTDAEPGRFARTAIRLAYHAQLAFYQAGLMAAGLGSPERAFIVAIETKPPYAITRFELTQRALEFGTRCYSLWLEQLLVCEASDSWPAYSQSIVPLDSPEDVNLIIDGEEIAV
jgi:hypothetical protein